MASCIYFSNIISIFLFHNFSNSYTFTSAILHFYKISALYFMLLFFSYDWFQHLEKERNHLVLETQSLLKALNIQKSEKDKLSQEVGHLEISLKQAKVLISFLERSLLLLLSLSRTLYISLCGRMDIGVRFLFVSSQEFCCLKLFQLK